jgi:hypothetical protein
MKILSSRPVPSPRGRSLPPVSGEDQIAQQAVRARVERAVPRVRPGPHALHVLAQHRRPELLDPEAHEAVGLVSVRRQHQLEGHIVIGPRDEASGRHRTDLGLRRDHAIDGESTRGGERPGVPEEDGAPEHDRGRIVHREVEHVAVPRSKWQVRGHEKAQGASGRDRARERR